MKNKILSVAAGTTLACAAALPLAAETTHAQLEARIAELERANAQDRPKLSFGVAGIDLQLYGYVKADLIYDLDENLGTTFFGLANIVPGELGGNDFQGQAIQSRIGIKGKFEGVTGVLEGDFFQGGGNGQFRIRKAYVDVGNFRLGQDWTTFMPIESYPSTLDFQGPAGIIFARVVQARYSVNFADGFRFAAAIEEPQGDSSDPAFVSSLSYSGGNYFVKAAAISRQADDGLGGDVDGYGFNLSGNAQLWQGGSINASYTTGEAIGSYFVFGGQDVFEGEGVRTDGLTLSISQQVNKWNFGVAYGLRDIDAGAVDGTERLETVHVTANYQVRSNTTVGLEYITGTRDLFNDTSESADRIQASVQFNF